MFYKKCSLKCSIFFKLNFYTQFYNSKKARQHTQHSDYSTGWMMWVANPGMGGGGVEALRPTQPPIWWVLEVFFQRKSGWGVRMRPVTYLHLVPRVRMDVSIYPVLYVPSWLILG